MKKDGFAKCLLSAAVALGLAWPIAAGAAETYSFDKNHTEIMFFYNHVGLSNQSGRFDEFDGSLVFDQKKPQNSKIEVTIKTASIDTDVAPLDEHLRSADFFNAAKHPEIKFVSTSVRQTGAKNGRVEGNLTMNGMTKPVTLDVTFNFAGEHPLAPYIPAYAGAPYTAFAARTTVLRSDFGLGKFAPLTSDTVEIVIETEMRQVK